jgi:hypothetical protein
METDLDISNIHLLTFFQFPFCRMEADWIRMETDSDISIFNFFLPVSISKIEITTCMVVNTGTVLDAGIYTIWLARPSYVLRPLIRSTFRAGISLSSR